MSTQTTDLPALRHTAAHLLAHAVVDLFGDDVQLAIGPAIENGFYYDFLKPTPFVPEDLPRIEARMKELIAQGLVMKGAPITRAEAEAYYAKRHQPFKLDILHGIPEGEPLTMYTIGGFTDLCRGGHVESGKDVGAVKLLSIAGAYWRGDEHNPMLQRIYGTAFARQTELDAYLEQLKEAERRDHRKLGRELDLFSIEEQAGPGLDLLAPQGRARARGHRGFHPPRAAAAGLRARAHAARRPRGRLQDVRPPADVRREHVRPARARQGTLPGQTHELPRPHLDLQIAAAILPRAALAPGGVRDRLSQRASGTLHGLLRVRMITMDDAHLFCTPDQLQQEFENTVDAALTVLARIQVR